MRGRWRPGVIFSTHLGDQVPHQVFSKNWPGGTVSCCATRKKRFEHEGRGAIFAGRYLYNGKRRARFSVALLVQFCPRTHTSVLFYPSLNLQDQAQPHAPVAIFFSPDDGWMCFLFFFARGLVKGCGGWREPHRGRGSSQGRNRLYLGQRKGAQPGRQPRQVHHGRRLGRRALKAGEAFFFAGVVVHAPPMVSCRPPPAASFVFDALCSNCHFPGAIYTLKPSGLFFCRSSFRWDTYPRHKAERRP